MKTTVRIPLQDSSDDQYLWSTAGAWLIENFGLPGDRFTSKVCENYLECCFNEEKDAMLMLLMWNGHVVSDSQLAVELMAKWINR